MTPFHFELIHTPKGAPIAAQILAMIAADPLLSEATRRWVRPEPPASADLYALIVVVTDDLADAAELRQRITEIEARGFPVIPVVESVAAYDFKRAPLPALARRNAVGLHEPDTLLVALFHHGGLRRHGTGGHVMISYARVDGSALAEDLHRGLVAAGFHVFMDIHEVAGGAAIQRDIKEAIERADLVLLVDSRGATASPWVAAELDMARAAHVPVLAVTRDRDEYHAFRAPHVSWPSSGAVAEVAEAAVAAARRLLAHKISFRDRVARALEQLATLRGWPLEEVPPEWLVRPHEPGVRVACIDEHPNAGDVVRFRKRLGQTLGILVAGTRPFPPHEAEGFRELGQDKVRVTTLAQVASALADRAAAGCLRGCRIFLSAAMPDESESEAAAHTLAPFVITFVQTVFSLGATVVFGGHPSITPMVHKAIIDIAAEDSGAIELHQAKLWIRALPMEAKERRIFGEICWHGVGKDIGADLSALRSGMIGVDLDAAVFVGGKVIESKTKPPGLVLEYTRFRDCTECPNRPAFLLGLADGAAASLIKAGEPPDDVVDPLIAHELATTHDPDLATALIVAELCRLPKSRSGS